MRTQYLIFWLLISFLFLPGARATESLFSKGKILIFLQTIPLPANQTSTQLPSFNSGETCFLDFAKSNESKELIRGSLWNVVAAGVKEIVHRQEIPVL